MPAVILSPTGCVFRFARFGTVKVVVPYRLATLGAYAAVISEAAGTA